MRTVLLSKFDVNPALKERLLSTGNAYLEERLWWRDIFWGFDVNLKQGENQLGLLLMQIRQDLQTKQGQLALPAHW
jgi:predicted NAD-dependent protein-ADP-ribosyltransferase YbiA (DUF1768 family)